jgi:hypothetical protein
MEISIRKSLVALTLVLAGIVQVNSIHSVTRELPRLTKFPESLIINNTLESEVMVVIFDEMGKRCDSFTLERGSLIVLKRETMEYFCKNPMFLSFFTKFLILGDYHTGFHLSDIEYQGELDEAIIDISRKPSGNLEISFSAVHPLAHFPFKPGK